MDIDDKKQKRKKKGKTTKDVSDDDETNKKPEVQLSSFSVTVDSLTQDQSIPSKHTASEKKRSMTRLSSATNARKKLSSQTSNDFNHAKMGQNDLAHHNTLVTAESEILKEKQRIAGRPMTDSIPKQGAFAEEATIEEITTSIQDDMILGSTQFEDKVITDVPFAKGAPKEVVTMGVKNNTIKGSHKFNKEAMMDGSMRKSHDIMQLSTAHPGALAIFPTGSLGPAPPTPNDGTISEQNESQHQLLMSTGDSDIEAHEPALKAVLVTEDPGVLASATLLDIEAEKKFHQRRRMRTMVGTLTIASIIAIAVAIPVVLTRPGPPPATFSPSSSPGPSATPSFLPSVRPSIQPSWVPSSSPSSGLFGFLVENSFDGGFMLSIAGSSQQRAMDWLLEVYGQSELDYYLLQAYALVTLYFETYGRQWISKVDFDEKRIELGSFAKKDSDYRGEWLNITPSVNPNGFCDWQGVLCNDKREIESLTLSSNRLYGSLPAELGMLHQSLSKFMFLLA